MLRKLWFIALTSLPLWAGAQSLSVRADQWMPVNGKPDDAGAEGLYIDILRAVAKDSGTRIDYQLQGWTDAVKAAQAGTVDCVVGAAKEDAPGLRFAARPWLVGHTAWYRGVDRTEIRAETVAELAKFKLGVIGGYAYGADIDPLIAAQPADKLESVTSSRDPLNAVVMRLVTGRIDLALETDFVMQAKLRSMQLADRIVQAGRSEVETEIYFACNNNPRVASFMQAVDAWIDARRADGTLAAFYAPYGLDKPE
ncbi:MAG: transporter substrate-binding domain-containing protein [Xanthomonadales bacterium]|jgi:polar amino acid transport system substrate-binding protein|nr:transporter substrate-binding domain-containing protein [Xanthomonadales bacterium]